MLPTTPPRPTAARCHYLSSAVEGDVTIQFGTGKVDFAGVFRVLKSTGFNGPVVVECCAVGETPEATADNARANRLSLEKVLLTI